MEGISLGAYSGSYRPRTGGTTTKESPAREEKKENAAQSAPKQTDKVPFSIQSILKKIEAVGMETDDLLLALVLFLMYRESGDKDLLILLGAMLLC